MTIILDVESTGVLPHPKLGHPQAIEIAYIEIPELQEFRNSNANYKTFFERFRPSMEISPRASEIHGIFFKDVRKCAKSESFVFPETEYMIGHNINYDWRCLEKPNTKLICTLSLINILKKRLKLPLENATLDYLVSFYFPEESKQLLKQYHNALDDVTKCQLLLQKILEFLPNITSWEELYKLQTIKKSKK